jgi:hypothetical protein
VSAVLSVACHTVNQMTRRMPALPSMSAIAPPLAPRARIAATGHANATASTTAGTAAAAHGTHRPYGP